MWRKSAKTFLGRAQLSRASFKKVSFVKIYTSQASLRTLVGESCVVLEFHLRFMIRMLGSQLMIGSPLKLMIRMLEIQDEKLFRCLFG